jgi:anti-sigma28 factor (negative regulator of flagellin synthesis)
LASFLRLQGTNRRITEKVYGAELKIPRYRPIFPVAKVGAVMKVTSQTSTGASTTGATSAQEIQKSSSGGYAASARSGAGGDTVELSSTLGSLSRAMDSYSSSRANQVQALAAQYQSGSYRADSSAISRGMISEALGG